MQIQIIWLLQKSTDLDIHCLLRQGMLCSAREGLRANKCPETFWCQKTVTRYYKTAFYLCTDLIRWGRKHNKTCFPFEELLFDKYMAVKIVINCNSSLTCAVRLLKQWLTTEFLWRNNMASDKSFIFRQKVLGPVVQSLVSLTSSLRVISLTVLGDSIHNILIFFAEKMWVAFALQKLLTFFQQKISAYLRITRCKF